VRLALAIRFVRAVVFSRVQGTTSAVQDARFVPGILLLSWQTQPVALTSLNTSAGQNNFLSKKSVYNTLRSFRLSSLAKSVLHSVAQPWKPALAPCHQGTNHGQVNIPSCLTTVGTVSLPGNSSGKESDRYLAAGQLMLVNGPCHDYLCNLCP